EALENANQFVRWHAADALAEIGPGAKAAAPKLAKFLKEDTPAVRVKAASALCRIDRKDQAAFAALVEALERTEYRLAAVQGLEALGPDARAAVPALAKALKGPDPLTRCAIVGALGNLGPRAEAATSALVAALNLASPCGGHPMGDAPLP